jgi:hypothetical protein
MCAKIGKDNKWDRTKFRLSFTLVSGTVGMCVKEVATGNQSDECQ